MEKFYQKMLYTIRQYPYIEKTIIQLCHILPYITFCIYPCVLFYLFITKNTLFYSTLWKPFTAFIIVSIFRKVVNRKRPYESMNIEPLLEHKQGESFPSRHTVSAFIIALVCLKVNVSLGTFTLIVAILIGTSRIVAGVHYISDVIVAILIAFMVYLI